LVHALHTNQVKREKRKEEEREKIRGTAKPNFCLVIIKKGLEKKKKKEKIEKI